MVVNEQRHDPATLLPDRNPIPIVQGLGDNGHVGSLNSLYPLHMKEYGMVYLFKLYV